MRSILRLAAEVGLSLMIIGVPFALGGVHKATIALACLVASMTLIALHLYRRTTKRRLRVTWFGLGLIGLTAYTAFQMVPLPVWLLGLIAPATAQVLTSSFAGIAGAPTGHGWHPISLDAASTFWETIKIGTCALAFIGAHNYLYRPNRRRRMLTLLLGGGVTLVLLGLIGAVVAPRHPLIFYSPTAAGGGQGLITTSFVNPNHGAAFLSLCLMSAVGLVLAVEDMQKKVMLTIAGVILGTGVFLTLSKGGIMAMSMALVVFTALLLLTNFLIANSKTSTPPFYLKIFGKNFRHSSETRLSLPLAVIPALVAMVLVVTAWLAYEDVTREFAHMLPDRNGDWSKAGLWPSGLAMVLANPIVGAGRGAFFTAFPRYLEVDLPNRIASHLENQYLHLPAELGIPVALAIFVATGAALWVWFVKGHHGPRPLALVAALLALALHNAIDFSLEILGVALPAAIIAGQLSAGVTSPRSHMKGDRPKRGRDLLTVARSSTALVLAVFMLICLGRALFAPPPDPWEDDRRLAALVKKKVPLDEFRKAAHAAILRHPADYMPHLALARYAAAAGKTEAMASLNKAMFLFPRSPQIHLEAARVLRRFGKRRQALLEYRTALEYGAAHIRLLREALPMVRSERDLEILITPHKPKVHAAMVTELLKVNRKASKARVARNLKMASMVAKKSIARWPNHEASQTANIEVLLAQGKTGEARAAAEVMIHQNQTAEAFLLLARAAGADKGPRAAIAVLVRAQRLLPGRSDHSFALTHAYIKIKDFESAAAVVKELQTYADSTKMLVKTHGLLSHIYKLSGDLHLSRHHAKQVERLRHKK